jgi:hypothetical protein
MKYAIFKQLPFYIGLASFFIGLFFVFQDGNLAHFSSYLWQVNFILNIYMANKAVHHK